MGGPEKGLKIASGPTPAGIVFLKSVVHAFLSRPKNPRLNPGLSFSVRNTFRLCQPVNDHATDFSVFEYIDTR
jgi:hypothetical protein